MSVLEVLEKVKNQHKVSEQKKIIKNVAVGAVVGATVGVAAGVLLAPKAGKETREELVAAAKELADKALKNGQKETVAIGEQHEPCLFRENNQNGRKP